MSRKIIRAITILLFMVIMVFYSIFVHNSFKESNMDKYNNVEQLINSNIKIGHVQFDENFSGIEELNRTAEEQLQGYYDAFDDTECIFVVKATGNIKFSYLVTFQEMTIEKVIKGNGVEGEKIKCIFEAGRLETTEDGVYLNTFGVNLMQKDKEYLLFCSSCDMSNYSDEEYYTNKNGICYFSLDNSNIAMVNEDCNLPYDDESSKYEFYVDCEEAVKSITEFKAKILDRYYIENKN